MLTVSSRSEDVEKRHLMHFRFGSLDSTSSSSSIHSSSSSSSTLHPLQDDDEEKCFSFDHDLSLIGEQEQPIFATAPHPQPHSWRRIPLTATAPTRLIFHLLFSLVPLLPSFLFASPIPRHLHATSHLDGLRGIAAFIVLLDHFVLNWYYTLRNGYLSSPADTSYLQFPIIRLIFAGRASVAIFFSISGFVLAYKPLLLIRAHNRTSAFDTLSSSIFRRAIRLYVPIIAGTLISAYLAYKGLYTPVPARTELLPPQMWTLYHQLKHWFYATIALAIAGLSSDPNRLFAPAYNGHLWTIPIEFYGSMVVFLSVLGLARARPGVRMCVLSALAAEGLWAGRWDLALFVGGAVIAEGSLACSSTEEVLPDHQDQDLLMNDDAELGSFFAALKPLQTPLAVILLVLSLYLLSYAGESPSPGLYHQALTPYVPYIYRDIHLGPEHFFLALGALLLLALLTLPFTPATRYLKIPLLSRPAQYLGDISYALYIVHGMVLFTLGTGLQERWTGQVGEERWVDNGVGELVQAVVRTERDEWEYWRAFWGVAGICMVVVVWCADLFWRCVDRNAVRWGRWFEGKVGSGV